MSTADSEFAALYASQQGRFAPGTTPGSSFVRSGLPPLPPPPPPSTQPAQPFAQSFAQPYLIQQLTTPSAPLPQFIPSHLNRGRGSRKASASVSSSSSFGASPSSGQPLLRPVVPAPPSPLFVQPATPTPVFQSFAPAPPARSAPVRYNAFQMQNLINNASRVDINGCNASNPRLKAGMVNRYQNIGKQEYQCTNDGGNFWSLLYGCGNDGDSNCVINAGDGQACCPDSNNRYGDPRFAPLNRNSPSPITQTLLTVGTMLEYDEAILALIDTQISGSRHLGFFPDQQQLTTQILLSFQAFRNTFRENLLKRLTTSSSSSSSSSSPSIGRVLTEEEKNFNWIRLLNLVTNQLLIPEVQSLSNQYQIEPLTNYIQRKSRLTDSLLAAVNQITSRLQLQIQQEAKTVMDEKTRAELTNIRLNQQGPLKLVSDGLVELQRNFFAPLGFALATRIATLPQVSTTSSLLSMIASRGSAASVFQNPVVTGTATGTSTSRTTIPREGKGPPRQTTPTPQQEPRRRIIPQSTTFSGLLPSSSTTTTAGKRKRKTPAPSTGPRGPAEEPINKLPGVRRQDVKTLKEQPLSFNQVEQKLDELFRQRMNQERKEQKEEGNAEDDEPQKCDVRATVPEWLQNTACGRHVLDLLERTEDPIEIKANQLSPVMHLMQENHGVLAYQSFGSGKTLTAALAIYCLMMSATQGIMDTIILANSVTIPQWGVELMRMGFPANFKIILDPSAEDFNAARGNTTVSFTDPTTGAVQEGSIPNKRIFVMTIQKYQSIKRTATKNKTPAPECKNIFLVVDEAHKLKADIDYEEEKKGSENNATAISNCAAVAKRILLLTGEAIPNDPTDIISLISLVKGEPPLPLSEFKRLVQDDLDGDSQGLDNYLSCAISYYHCNWRTPVKPSLAMGYPTVREVIQPLIMPDDYLMAYQAVEDKQTEDDEKKTEEERKSGKRSRSSSSSIKAATGGLLAGRDPQYLHTFWSGLRTASDHLDVEVEVPIGSANGSATGGEGRKYLNPKVQWISDFLDSTPGKLKTIVYTPLVQAGLNQLANNLDDLQGTPRVTPSYRKKPALSTAPKKTKRARRTLPENPEGQEGGGGQEREVKQSGGRGTKYDFIEKRGGGGNRNNHRRYVEVQGEVKSLDRTIGVARYNAQGNEKVVVQYPKGNRNGATVTIVNPDDHSPRNDNNLLLLAAAQADVNAHSSSKRGSGSGNYSYEIYNPVNIILISDAGSEGLDLKRTRNVIVYKPGWNRSTSDQGIARGARKTSHRDIFPLSDRNVDVYYLILNKPDNWRDIVRVRGGDVFPGKNEDDVQKIMGGRKDESVDKFMFDEYSWTQGPDANPEDRSKQDLLDLFRLKIRENSIEVRPCNSKLDERTGRTFYTDVSSSSFAPSSSSSFPPLPPSSSSFPSSFSFPPSSFPLSSSSSSFASSSSFPPLPSSPSSFLSTFEDEGEVL